MKAWRAASPAIVAYATMTACVPSTATLSEHASRGTTAAEVVKALGEPKYRANGREPKPLAAMVSMAPTAWRRERIAEAWPYSYRTGSAIVYFDANGRVECAVRMNVWLSGGLEVVPPR